MSSNLGVYLNFPGHLNATLLIVWLELLRLFKSTTVGYFEIIEPEVAP